MSICLTSEMHHRSGPIDRAFKPQRASDALMCNSTPDLDLEGRHCQSHPQTRALAGPCGCFSAFRASVSRCCAATPSFVAWALYFYGKYAGFPVTSVERGKSEWGLQTREQQRGEVKNGCSVVQRCARTDHRVAGLTCVTAACAHLQGRSISRFTASSGLAADIAPFLSQAARVCRCRLPFCLWGV